MCFGVVLGVLSGFSVYTPLYTIHLVIKMVCVCVGCVLWCGVGIGVYSVYLVNCKCICWYFEVLHGGSIQGDVTKLS